MKPEQFCYWLQGMLESGKVTTLDEADVTMIKEHLQLVFLKVDPEKVEEMINLLLKKDKQIVTLGNNEDKNPPPFSPSPTLLC